MGSSWLASSHTLNLLLIHMSIIPTSFFWTNHHHPILQLPLGFPPPFLSCFSPRLPDIQSYTAKTWNKPSQNRSFFQACWPFTTNKDRENHWKAKQPNGSLWCFCPPPTPVSGFTLAIFRCKTTKPPQHTEIFIHLNGTHFPEISRERTWKYWGQIAPGNFQGIFEGRFPLLKGESDTVTSVGRVFICHSLKCFILHSPHWIFRDGAKKNWKKFYCLLFIDWKTNQ